MRIYLTSDTDIRFPLELTNRTDFSRFARLTMSSGKDPQSSMRQTRFIIPMLQQGGSVRPQEYNAGHPRSLRRVCGIRHGEVLPMSGVKNLPLTEACRPSPQKDRLRCGLSLLASG